MWRSLSICLSFCVSVCSKNYFKKRKVIKLRSSKRPGSCWKEERECISCKCSLHIWNKNKLMRTRSPYSLLTYLLLQISNYYIDQHLFCFLKNCFLVLTEDFMKIFQILFPILNSFGKMLTHILRKITDLQKKYFHPLMLILWSLFIHIEDLFYGVLRNRNIWT